MLIVCKYLFIVTSTDHISLQFVELPVLIHTLSAYQRHIYHNPNNSLLELWAAEFGGQQVFPSQLKMKKEVIKRLISSVVVMSSGMGRV